MYAVSKQKKMFVLGEKASALFTLVEMLIVIAIIGILAALLMPALENSLLASRQMACANNLKRTGVGFLIYANANDSFLPYLGTMNWGSGLQNPWYGNIDSDATGIVFCPQDYVSTVPAQRLKWGNISYGYNRHGLSGNGVAAAGARYQRPARVSEVRKPARTVLCLDNAAALASGNVRGYYHVYAWYDANNPVAYTRHRDNCNVLWLDGHVQAEAAPLPQLLYAAGALGNWFSTAAENHWDRD